MADELEKIIDPAAGKTAVDRQAEVAQLDPMHQQAARTADPALEAEMMKATPQAEEPMRLVAPAQAEDPSRSYPAIRPTGTFAGFPKTKYHPVYGSRVVNDPNEEASLPLPLHNWFGTAEEADAHRTDLEAQQAMHNNNRVKVDAANTKDYEPDPADPHVRGESGVVRNSVSATESLKRGFAEPL